MPTLEAANIYGVQIRESANDGSDFSNAASDYRIMFVGEDGLFHLKDSAGTVTTPTGMADPMTTRGDMIVRNASNVTARLAVGATSGMVLRSNGTDPAWALPPGHEFAYVEFTSPVSITATVESSSNSIVSAGAVSFDGSTRVEIEVFVPNLHADPVVGRWVAVNLFDGSTCIGYYSFNYAQVNTTENTANFKGSRFLTPSNASHTYSARGLVSAGTGTATAGAAGAGNYLPGYIRITKA